MVRCIELTASEKIFPTFMVLLEITGVLKREDKMMLEKLLAHYWNMLKMLMETLGIWTKNLAGNGNVFLMNGNLQPFKLSFLFFLSLFFIGGIERKKNIITL